MSIHLLPPEVASQIAAGEVVERPSSVVKELLENALDAGATHIHVAAEEAGRRLVEVADDGRGIPAGELPLAVERHATSKLSRAEDLFNIATLGFRGEALASIGSVSHMTITSRAAGADHAMRMRVSGGQVGSPEAVGAPVGTLVQVEDIFFNVPARLKFLKSDLTERRQIDLLVTRYALAYPYVRFQLRQDERPGLHTSGNGDRREVMAALYGVDVARQMIEVLSEDEHLRLNGFTSPTSLTRSNRREITFFVNGRPVQDGALSAAVIQAYHTLLMVGRYPLAVIFLEIPPFDVDVNVHPTKAEVRFREPDRIFERGAARAAAGAAGKHACARAGYAGRRGGGCRLELARQRMAGLDGWRIFGACRGSAARSGAAGANAFRNRRTGPRHGAAAARRADSAAAPGGADLFSLPGCRRPGWVVPDRPTCRP